MTIIYSKNYSFRKKWELFIQKIIQLQKNYSTKYSFKKFENYSFKIIIHFFEKLIIAQGYHGGRSGAEVGALLVHCLFTSAQMGMGGIRQSPLGIGMPSALPSLQLWLDDLTPTAGAVVVVILCAE